MKVLVDTSVWSAVLRRPEHPRAACRTDVEELIREGRLVMLGPIRQELLSGLRTEQAFKKLQAALRAFPDHPVQADDFEHAAHCFNQCRGRGIQGSNTDFLICAVALRNRFELLTTDVDFDHFASVLPLKRYDCRF